MVENKRFSPLSFICERDLELLLLEEFSVSSYFRDWFVTKLYSGQEKVFKFVNALHAPDFSYLGKADILFLFEGNAGKRHAVIIENKLDMQKKGLQAERYFEIGEKGVADGKWDYYLTCLFSPQAYFGSLDASEYFSAYFGYEDFLEWFALVIKRQPSPRAEYRQKLINAAILQNQKGEDVEPRVSKRKLPEGFKIFPGGVQNIPEGYQVARELPVSPFWQDYHAFCGEHFAHLGMGALGQETRIDLQWAVFNPEGFEKGASIIHKMPQGFMDLAFTATTEEDLEHKYARFIDSDMSIRQTGGTAVIRISVPAIADPHGFEMVKDMIGFSLTKANKLYALYRKVNGAIPPIPTINTRGR